MAVMGVQSMSGPVVQGTSARSGTETLAGGLLPVTVHVVLPIPVDRPEDDRWD
ncbi:hypothetical protein OG625_08040 [Streptomyces sp. NBC_01351]|uniref:hypothetical protein n=1 Tax=Streptomyces sp. NBC_01351 TaxID=2903833 RepID=UPI002E34F773|nr:hypothetical protein [Streptomyces sp. NBC_01351]